jgi:deoxycytidylate deaminase
VGSLIVSEDNQPISFGFNGFPKGDDDALWKYLDRGYKYKHTIHAELNAILNSQGGVLKGSRLYCTHPPCTHCLGVIKQAGIGSVVCYKGSKEFTERWGETYILQAEDLGICLKVVDRDGLDSLYYHLWQVIFDRGLG